MNQIAKKEGVTYYAVKYWMHKYDIPRRKGGKLLSPFTLDQVKKIYYENGLSVPEVAKMIEVSQKALYRFMERNDLPRRSAVETNAIRFAKSKPSYILRSNLTEREKQLKIAGVMLYWAEGRKSFSDIPGKRSGGSIDFANSDPKMITLFLKFLRNICGVDEKKLRAYLYYFSNQDIEDLKIYWHNITGIPLNQFTKPYVRNDFDPKKKGKMKYGLLHIRYFDKKLLLQILEWIDKFAEYF